MGKWVTIKGAHVYIEDGQNFMDAFIKQKGGNNDYKILEKLSESKALNDDYSNSTDRIRDMAKDFYKELGYDESPQLVDEEKYSKLQQEGYREIYRGIRGYGVEGKNGQDFLEQYKQGEMFIGNQRVFGSGTYYTYETNFQGTVNKYSNMDGATYSALIDKNAKIITANKLNELKAEYTNKAIARATEINKSDPERANKYYNQMNNIINKDNGIFASALGYDAIDVEDAKYIVSMNRSKVIMKK